MGGFFHDQLIDFAQCGLIRDAEVFPESGCVGKAPAVVVDSQIRRRIET